MTRNVDITWLCQQLAARTGLSRQEAGEIIRAAMVAGDLTSLAPQATYTPEDASQLSPLSNHGRKLNFVLPSDIWKDQKIDWEHRRPHFNFYHEHGVYLIPEIHVSAAKAYDFILSKDPVMQLSPITGESAPVNFIGTKKTGGAPSKIDWEVCLIKAASWMYVNGIPKTQAELFAYIVDWLGPAAPSLTQLKKHLTPLYQAFEQADQSD